MSGDPGDEHRDPVRREVAFSAHWQCEKCFCRCYFLVERGDERLSWCFGCYDEHGEKRKPLTLEQVRGALDIGAKERTAAERVSRGRRIGRR